MGPKTLGGAERAPSHAEPLHAGARATHSGEGHHPLPRPRNGDATTMRHAGLTWWRRIMIEMHQHAGAHQIGGAQSWQANNRACSEVLTTPVERSARCDATVNALVVIEHGHQRSTRLVQLRVVLADRLAGLGDYDRRYV